MLLVAGEVRVTEQSCMCAALTVTLSYRVQEAVLRYSEACCTHVCSVERDNRVRKMLELELSKNIVHTAILPAMPAPMTMSVPFGG